MTTSESQLSMMLLIDTKARKVLFAEAEKDCVDFLFHILSLPVGSVIKLLKTKVMSGSLHNLYESVENLNDAYIQLKDVLLNPKSSIGIPAVPLQMLNDIPTQRTFYGCNYSYSHSAVSDNPSAMCPYGCGQKLSRNLTYVDPPKAKEAVTAKGGFVKEVVTYMVMDDLAVKPLSLISGINLLNKFNVNDVSVLQEEVVSFGMEEALELLKASFESKTVLTNVFMSRVKEEN